MEPGGPAESACATENVGYDFVRFGLIVYIGTPIAILGVLCNCVLFRLFSKARSRRSPTLYLLILATFDLLMDLFYVPFFTVDALAIYGENVMLHEIWHTYAIFLYGAGKLVQFASTYIVLCATIERFIVVAEIHSLDFLVSERGRYCTIGVVLFGVFLLRLPAFFEYTIEYLPKCAAFQNYEFKPLLSSEDNYRIYNFYVMTVLHIFVPFALLLLLNISIVAVTKKKLRHIGWAATTFIDMPKITELIRKESISSAKKRRDELRYATWTMVSIVTSYLCCNTFSLFISIMENYFADNSLMYEPDGSSTQFYTLTSDLCSILVALNSLLRLFIYMLCSPSIRAELIKQCPLFAIFEGNLPKHGGICCRLGLTKKPQKTTVLTTNNNNNALDDDGSYGRDYRRSLIAAGYEQNGQML
ncbi:unnamed protein product, partial [Mesorhabditis spiculigera]